MQDEDIDKIIREAAGQHHPPYDDTAWDKMEQLLDKHLPQKKERKKRPYFLLLAFLLAGGAFYTFVYPGIKFSGTDKTIAQNNGADKNDDRNAAKSSHLSVQPEATITTGESNANMHTGPSVKNITAAIAGTSSADNTDNIYAANAGIKVDRKARSAIHVKNAHAISGDTNLDDNNNTLRTAQEGPTVAEMKTKAGEVSETQTKISSAEKDLAQADNDKKKIKPEEKKDSAVKKDADKTNVAGKDKEEDKKKTKVPGNFGITASAGSDISFINTGDPGKATFLYGAGVSYDINKRFKVRAGFYVSKKIYAAKPSEYGGTVYPNLVNIDGNCKVYEIPVSVNYNFAHAKKHSWFGGVGLSSFIMKKENYQYNYKTSAGVTYNYKEELNNKNKHLFSVLNLSAGYQYDMSSRVSLMAEPFIKVPLTGIGKGKVKLNSAGIMLTATVKPFNKKKK